MVCDAENKTKLLEDHQRFLYVARAIANGMSRATAFQHYDNVIYAQQDALTNPSKHTFNEDENGNSYPSFFSSDCEFPECMLVAKDEKQVKAIMQDLINSEF